MTITELIADLNLLATKAKPDAVVYVQFVIGPDPNNFESSDLLTVTLDSNRDLCITGNPS